jgi:hypothetical protein
MALYYYHPELGRLTSEILAINYSINDEKTAVENGFYPLSMSQPEYNKLTQRVVDKGTVIDNGVAYVDWEITPLSLETMKVNLVNQFNSDAVKYMDKVAQAKGYDNRIACSMRAGFDGPFKAEGQAFAIWMDTCFATMYLVMERAEKGEIPIPTTFNELLQHLPTPPWNP